jgi:hypothetical protein
MTADFASTPSGIIGWDIEVLWHFIGIALNCDGNFLLS